jgi:hypothetical protein
MIHDGFAKMSAKIIVEFWFQVCHLEAGALSGNAESSMRSEIMWYGCPTGWKFVDQLLRNANRFYTLYSYCSLQEEKDSAACHGSSYRRHVEQ